MRSLCKDFRRLNGTVFAALEGVNLDVYEGEVLSILGLSGSGKSTLLRLMSGIQKPDRGQLQFSHLGQDNFQNVSMAFQNPSLFPWLTVYENIELSVSHLSKEKRKKNVEEALVFGGLSGFDDSYPRDLSVGMRQRVNLCRALVSNPMILALDEPLTSLDPLTAQSLRAEIERIWMQPDRRIKSMVLATHNVKEAVTLSDRIVILSAHPGRIYKTVEVTLPRPRNPNDPATEQFESMVEKIFGELHLDKLGGEEDNSPLFAVQMSESGQTATAQKEPRTPTRQRRVGALFNIGLVSMEGLLTRLLSETEPVDIYDLSEELGYNTEQMLHVVASAELLGFVTTPGTNVILTEAGRALAEAQDATDRRNFFRSALLGHPLIAEIHKLLVENGSEGFTRSAALEIINNMLPLEDADGQFEALVKMGRYSDLFHYDDDSEILYIES